MSSHDNKLGFGTKILIMVLVSSICLAIITSAIALKLYVGSYHSFIELYKKSLYSDFDSQAKTQVETATSSCSASMTATRKAKSTWKRPKNSGLTCLGSCAMLARTAISGLTPPTA